MAFTIPTQMLSHDGLPKERLFSTSIELIMRNIMGFSTSTCIELIMRNIMDHLVLCAVVYNSPPPPTRIVRFS